MASDDDRLGPSGHKAWHVFANDGLTEHNAPQDVADGPVGGFPHFFQPEFFDPCFIGCDGRAFDADAVFLDRLCRVDGDLIVGIIARLNAQIIIF